ncbi:uncharacterized protein [Parasteatoda tepidariorum]|uniref:uncharacterized protein n=1 Tax=Parasteatoda tepidariorum TaxID=114398 RepID=UPI00077F8DB6|nr:uncharacterized protein LOC107447017 [Parasteatoda tepidariorum]
MNIVNFSSIFNRCLNAAAHNINKISVRTPVTVPTKGTRKIKNARRYKRPEDLVDPYYYGLGPKKEVQSMAQSISDRGFAREQQAYQPSPNVDEQLLSISKKIFGSELSAEWKNHPLDDLLLKYKVITKSIETFKRNVPNSMLHRMKTLEDLLTYFSTPVDGALPYDALLRDNEKLPPNLHIMSDTPTFNPDTDSFFDGITAYPGRKRIVYTKTGEKFEKIIEWPNI